MLQGFVPGQGVKVTDTRRTIQREPPLDGLSAIQRRIGRLWMVLGA